MDFGTAKPAVNSFERAKFNGRASEYFGIWIVNILLTVITLGIYSAWAKVRRNRYFYGNTVLLGSSFEYHATGKQIFIGRLIVFGLVVVLNILTTLHPLFAFVTLILVLIAMPWLIMRGIRFNARVMSYRNVRFDFVGTVGGAFAAVMVGGFLAAISLGLLAPFASRWLNRYVFNNLRYGDRKFLVDPRIGSLYLALVIPAIITIIGFVILGVLIAGAVATQSSGNLPGAVLVGSIYLVTFGVVIVYALAGIIYRAAVHNIVWSSMVIDGRHRLRSDLSRGRYVWITLSNLVVTICTFGLMRPWAVVRLTRYVVEHTAIAVDGDIGDVVTAVQQSGGAVGSEYMSMEGFDFGF
ncbi:YjgN family protein [Rhizobium sp. KDH_Rht_773_N]